MSRLSTLDKENFWLRCFLNPQTTLLDAVISRAYRDFNRTLHSIKEKRTEESHQALKLFIKDVVDEVLTRKFINQHEFDSWHEEQCKELISKFQTLSNHIIFVGQAQKWINMTLKYLFALGEDRIPNISMNYKYFHIPIDKIMQDELKLHGIPRLAVSWSRVDSYEKYLEYQMLIRDTFRDEIPMDLEFRFYNKSFDACLA